jgi:hypothetical protein
MTEQQHHGLEPVSIPLAVDPLDRKRVARRERVEFCGFEGKRRRLRNLRRPDRFRRIGIDPPGTASLTLGTSGFTTPIVPDASQPRTNSDAACQERRSSDLRTYSPRNVPWTQIGQADLQLFEPLLCRDLPKKEDSGMCWR